MMLLSKIILPAFDLKKIISSKKYDYFMFSVCVLYCLTALPNLDISDLFKNIIIFGSAPLIYFCCKDKLYDKKIIFLFFASFLIQIASWGNSLLVIPDVAKSTPDVKLLSSLFLFVFIAFWVNNKPKRRIILLSSLLFSFVFTIIVHHINHNSLSLAMLGYRMDFGLHNAQYTTMISAVIGMVSTYLLSNQKRPLSILITPILISIIILSIFIFVTSQSRQIWLTTVIILFFLPLIIRKNINKKMIFSFYLSLLVLTIGALNTGFIQKRITIENSTVKKILTGNWNNIPMTSFGIRFNSWLEASDWILEHPLIGSSKVAVKQVLVTSEIFQSNSRTKGFGHLHNYYVETLVSFGLIGFLFLISYYSLISRNILTNIDDKGSTFFICFIMFWIIINNFESYNSKYYGLYIQNIILGSLFFMPKPRITVCVSSTTQRNLAKTKNK